MKANSYYKLFNIDGFYYFRCLSVIDDGYLGHLIYLNRYGLNRISLGKSINLNDKIIEHPIPISKKEFNKALDIAVKEAKE